MEVLLPLSNKGWQVVITSDMSDMLAQKENIQNTILKITIIATLVILLILLGFSAKITHPLKYIANQMETMDYEKLSIELSLTGSYKEINQLYSGYNKMLKRINNLIDTVSYERLRQKEAHFEALQSAINPHFLYNTLQSIYSLAILERTTDVEVVTIALSDMLEYITYEKSKQVLFSQELDYINNYLEIQRIRYNNNFTVEYHIEETAKSCLINKLLVQPIVENAINHGFSQLLKEGLLMIFAYVSADNLIIEIVDNGIGMDKEPLNHLIRRMNNPQIDNKHKSIGLSNIQERIHLKYGSDYGLTILSEAGAGTRVILKIPAQYQGR